MIRHKNKPKVLIVDDIAENLQILMGTLKDDFSVIAAKNGETALRLANTNPKPDAILLDIMMPGMDGYEVCLKLKANPDTWDIPVLFVTALDQMDDEARGLTVGAVDFITKPFQPELVRARVQSQIELKQHKNQLEELVKQRTAELQLTQDVTIFTLANLAEARDPETGGHIKRTQNYVRLLAEQLRTHPRFKNDLTAEVVELLYKSAPLHDIGKVGVADHILLKPGRLTDDEFKEMKKHSVYGWNALKSAQKHLGSSSFLRYAGEITLSHHEKWDGTGYPKKLKGEAIPLSGRLMALADVYDALISKRVYKPPFSHDKAKAIIEEGRDSHFDSDIVDGFLAIHEQFRQTGITYADSQEERDALVGNSD
ncbi:MAG: two-component system response regulator [Magnetococcales bacterium]|nr:two-component system response regulator [Magnetococcales bacterium]